MKSDYVNPEWLYINEPSILFFVNIIHTVLILLLICIQFCQFLYILFEDNKTLKLM